MIPISFALPVEVAPEAIFVEGASATGCPGVENGVPTAESGKLCIYKKTGPNAPSISSGTGFPNPGADSNGAVMFFTCASPSCTWAGSWAVTAE